MHEIKYKVYFNDESATKEQLKRVEEITVEQEVDMAWEGRIKMFICLDEKGNWSGEDESFMSSFSRVRVEIIMKGRLTVPLIDGTIVGFDSQMSSQPGESTITLIVHDDSIFLDIEERFKRYENMLDHEVADDLFKEFSRYISETRIEKTPSTGSPQPPVVVQRETSMQLLRRLARRQGMHAYVLPGDNPGNSIGCFRTFSKKNGGLPALVLLGPDRNIESFNVRNNARKPASVKASILRITDKSIVSSLASTSAPDLLGDEPALADPLHAAVHILPPFQGESVSVNQATLAAATAKSYAFEATGDVLGRCYKAVLSPYVVVTVKSVNSRLSGDYLISRVTHKISRSEYTQSFALRRNAKSSGSAAGDLSPKESVF